MIKMIKQLTAQLIGQRERILRLSKEGGWIVAGQVITVLGALVLVRVLTEYLQPAEYGQLALALTISGLVNQVATGGIGNGISRFYSIAAEKGDLWGYLRASRRLMGYATLVVVAFGLVLTAALIAAGQLQWVGLTAAVLALSILSGFNSSLSGIQNAARQRPIVALHSGMNAWLKIGFAAGLMLWLGASSTAVVIGYILSALLVTTSQFFFLKRLLRRRQGVKISGSGKEDWARQMWLFSWPFSTWGIFTWIQQASDRWALETFAGVQDVGQYVAVFQLGYAPIGMVTGLMLALLAPILYQRSGNATDPVRNASVRRIVWVTTQSSLAITGLGFGFTWLFHDWLFQWLVAEPFRNVSHYLPWVVLAGGLFAAGQTLSLKMISDMRSKALLHAKIGTAIVGVGVNFLGAFWLGLTGVVMGLVIFSTVYLLWIIYLSKYLPVQLMASELEG
jgi:O-antigen/teichoic acid export membrane protein